MAGDPLSSQECSRPNSDPGSPTLGFVALPPHRSVSWSSPSPPHLRVTIPQALGTRPSQVAAEVLHALSTTSVPLDIPRSDDDRPTSSLSQGVFIDQQSHFPLTSQSSPEQIPSSSNPQQQEQSIQQVARPPSKSPDSAEALSAMVVSTVPARRHMGHCLNSSKKITASHSTAGSTTRHPSFYFKEDLVTISVDGCIYKLHRFILENNSQYFRSLFAAIANSDGPGSGNSDEDAIVVESLEQSDFDCLLEFLYHGAYKPHSLSLDTWKTLLAASTHLQFVSIRELSIHEITCRRASLSAVEAVVLATDYGVPQWLPDAYAELSQRPHPLDDHEAEQLGARVVARIGRAREGIREGMFAQFQMKRYGLLYAPSEPPEKELVTRVVRDVFWPGSN
ncbi:hypothetical protein CERSUDRAFT_95128 [Gelatoporia subvermispora B]|uniref:BTB domain-containing protein n=1 Tax=Ceriporiopsis subvermispora (strain B) TaxID=914234 RepID=M2RDF8_CERS8|nr:hypothetical protein CERSUDRAFT_95128 [Gelatoporia subvermispora B]